MSSITLTVGSPQTPTPSPTVSSPPTQTVAPIATEAPGIEYLHTLRGPKVMLLGEVGCGKTWVLRTLLPSYTAGGQRKTGAGLKVAAIFTEPGMDAVADVPCEDGFHFMYIPAATPSWDSLLKSTKLLSTMTMKDLAHMDGIEKREYQDFYKVIQACANFKCDRCQQTFGPVDKLPVGEWAVAFDSLSGLSSMAMNLVIGSKPVKDKGDWQIAMDNVERFNTKITNDIDCTVVTLSHIEREPNELTGGENLTMSTLGRKLAPKLIKPYSDVIHVKRKENNYSWSTVTPNMTLKTRNLTYAENLPPTFEPLIKSWRAKGGAQSES